MLQFGFFKVFLIFPVPPFEFFGVADRSFGKSDRQPITIKHAPVYLNALKQTVFLIQLFGILPNQILNKIYVYILQMLFHILSHAGYHK